MMDPDTAPRYKKYVPYWNNLSFANSRRIIPPFFRRFIFIAVIVGLRPVEMKFQRAGKLIKLNHE